MVVASSVDSSRRGLFTLKIIRIFFIIINFLIIMNEGSRLFGGGGLFALNLGWVMPYEVHRALWRGGMASN